MFALPIPSGMSGWPAGPSESVVTDASAAIDGLGQEVDEVISFLEALLVAAQDWQEQKSPESSAEGAYQPSSEGVGLGQREPVPAPPWFAEDRPDGKGAPIGSVKPLGSSTARALPIPTVGHPQTRPDAFSELADPAVLGAADIPPALAAEDAHPISSTSARSAPDGMSPMPLGVDASPNAIGQAPPDLIPNDGVVAASDPLPGLTAFSTLTKPRAMGVPRDSGEPVAPEQLDGLRSALVRGSPEGTSTRAAPAEPELDFILMAPPAGRKESGVPLVAELPSPENRPARMGEQRSPATGPQTILDPAFRTPLRHGAGLSPQIPQEVRDLGPAHEPRGAEEPSAGREPHERPRGVLPSSTGLGADVDSDGPGNGADYAQGSEAPITRVPGAGVSSVRPEMVPEAAEADGHGTQLIRQLADGVEAAARTPQESVEIRLRPDGLGSVSLRVAVNDRSVSIHIEVDSAMTRDLVQATWLQLSQALDERGLAVDQLLLHLVGGQAGSGDWGRHEARQQMNRSSAAAAPFQPSGPDAEGVAEGDLAVHRVDYRV